MAGPAGQSKQDKEVVSHQCNLCKLSYASEPELREHFWSLMHHMKIEEKKKNSLHNCTVCYAVCATIGEYRKHLTGEKHQKAVEKYTEDCKKAKEEREKQSTSVSANQPFEEPDEIIPDNVNPPHYGSREHPWQDSEVGMYPYTARNEQNSSFMPRLFPQPEYRRHYNKQWSKEGQFASRGDFEEHEYYNQQRDFPPYHYSGFMGRYNRDSLERPPRDFGRRHFDHHNDNFYKDFNSRDGYKRGSHQFGSERRDFDKYSQNGQIERPPRDFAKGTRWDQPFKQSFGHSEYPEYRSFDNPHWHTAQWEREPPAFYSFEEEMSYHNRSNSEGSGQRMPGRDPHFSADDSLNRSKSFQTNEIPEGSERNESREGSPSVSSSNPDPLEQSNGRKRVRDSEGESSASKASKKAEFISELRKRHASPANSPSRDFLQTSDNNPFVELAHASLGYIEPQMESLSSSDRCVTSTKDSGVKKMSSPLQRKRTVTPVRPRFIGGKAASKNIRTSRFAAGKKSTNTGEAGSSENGDRNSPRNGVLETAEKLCRELREKRQNAQREKEKLLLRQKQKSLNSRIASLSKTNQSYLKGHLSRNETVSSISALPPTRIALESSHSHSTGLSNDLHQASGSEDRGFSSLPLPQKSSIEKIRQEIESSVRGTKRFVRSSCENKRPKEKQPGLPENQKTTSRPVGKGKGPMSKDSLAKMVNAPRSRKERLQLAQIVRSHSKTQNKLAPSRLNVQLSGLYDNDNLDFDDEEMSEITLEDLSPQVKMQIARLIEDDIVDFDAGFVSTSPKTPQPKKQKSKSQLMEVDGDLTETPAKQEPETESTELTLADLVSPSQSTSRPAANIAEQNNQGDSTVDSGHVTDERVPTATSNEHLESSIADPTEDSTVDVVPPDVRAASPRETANSRPHSPHVTDTASGTSSQPLSNILSSVLYLSQKEEEKQAELESVQMRMGRLHNWLQQILNHLANFDVRQTKLQEEIKSLREERVQLINSAMTGSHSAIPSVTMTTMTGNNDTASTPSVSSSATPTASSSADRLVNIVPETVSSSNLPNGSLYQSTLLSSEPQNMQAPGTAAAGDTEQMVHLKTGSRTPASGLSNKSVFPNSTAKSDSNNPATLSVSLSSSNQHINAFSNPNQTHISNTNQMLFCKPNQTPVSHTQLEIEASTTSQKSTSEFAIGSIQEQNEFSSNNQLPAAAFKVGSIQAQNGFHSSTEIPTAVVAAAASVAVKVMSGIQHHQPNGISVCHTPDKNNSDKTINMSDSFTSASADSRDNVDISKSIKAERVSPPLSETVSSSVAVMGSVLGSSEASHIQNGNISSIFSVDGVRTARRQSVSEESRSEARIHIVSPGHHVCSLTARRSSRTLSETKNSNFGLTSSTRISESENMPSSQSQDESCVEKGSSMPVKYVGTFRGDLDSTDILQKVAANLGSLNKMNAISYLYLDQKESADVQRLVSTSCVDSSANNVVHSSSDVQLMDLDMGSSCINAKQMTPREESDLASVASNSSLGEKIKRFSHGDVLKTAFYAVEGSQSDGDKTLEAEDNVQNSDNTPGRIIKQCSVVLEKLEITKHNIEEQKFVLVEPSSLSPPHRRKRKTKKERDLISHRKHKYWVDSSSSESASQDETVKEDDMSSLKQQLVFKSKSDEENNSDDLQNIQRKDLKEDKGVHSTGDAGSSQLTAKATVKEEEENSDALKIDPKQVKLKPVEPICGNVMSSVGLVTNRATDDVDSASDRTMFVGAQTAVSGLQVFQNELYVSYQGIENVKRFDIYSGKPVMKYETTFTEHFVVLKSVMEEIQIKMFVGGSSRIMRVFDVQDSAPVDSVAVSSAVQCIHAAGPYVYLGLASGAVHVVSKKSHKTKDIFLCADKPIHSMTSTKEAGRVLLCVGAQDATIAICDSHSGLPIRILEGHTKTSFSIMASQDYVFSGSGDKTVMVHNLHNGHLEWTYSDHMGMVTSVWYWNDLLFSAGFDGLVRCFDLKNRVLKQMYYGAGKGPITSMAVYDNKLYTGNRKGDVECISLELDKSWSCRCPGCKYVFGLRSHLLHHMVTEHTSPNTNMMRCPWKDCPQWISTENNNKVVEEHLKKHIDDTVLVTGDGPNIATVIPMVHKE